MSSTPGSALTPTVTVSGAARRATGVTAIDSVTGLKLSAAASEAGSSSADQPERGQTQRPHGRPHGSRPRLEGCRNIVAGVAGL